MVITAQSQRTQERNRDEALERLVDLIRQAAVRPVKRRATKPTKASREKRLEGKKRRSGIKGLRQSKAADSNSGDRAPRGLAAATRAPVEFRLALESGRPMPVRQLTEAIVNRIAAGEVVERPASVVKELVENALDAGATRIEVVTDGGGRRLIRVTDDGDGMTRARSRRSRSSATPPPSCADDDLLAIRTLGFRGEALALDRRGRAADHHHAACRRAACLGASSVDAGVKSRGQAGRARRTAPASRCATCSTPRRRG